MTTAAYPFFGRVADATGYLLALQSSVGSAQIQRRMQEQLGHRQFVQRTTRHVIRTVVYRGVLDETSTKGHYRQEPPYHVGDEDVAAWLLEAALRAQGAESVRLQALPTTQQLFPFRLATPSLTRLVERLHLELFRQGGNEDVVILRC